MFETSTLTLVWVPAHTLAIPLYWRSFFSTPSLHIEYYRTLWLLGKYTPQTAPRQPIMFALALLPRVLHSSCTHCAVQVELFQATSCPIFWILFDPVHTGNSLVVLTGHSLHLAHHDYPDPFGSSKLTNYSQRTIYITVDRSHVGVTTQLCWQHLRPIEWPNSESNLAVLWLWPNSAEKRVSNSVSVERYRLRHTDFGSTIAGKFPTNLWNHLKKKHPGQQAELLCNEK